MQKEQPMNEFPVTLYRVVVSSNGEAISPFRAKSDHDIQPEIIYVRDDGWALGAPKQFASVAFDLWAGNWVDSWVLDKGEWQSMSDKVGKDTFRKVLNTAAPLSTLATMIAKQAAGAGEASAERIKGQTP